MEEKGKTRVKNVGMHMRAILKHGLFSSYQCAVLFQCSVYIACNKLNSGICLVHIMEDLMLFLSSARCT